MSHALLSPEDIEKRAESVGLTMAEVCRRAGTAHSTYRRWRKGQTSPNVTIYARWLEVIEAAGSARAAA